MSGPYVVQLDLTLASALESGLVEQGFALSKPPYTLFQAKKSHLTVTLYESGKLVIQGSAMKEFIENYLEPEVLKSFSYGYDHLSQDRRARIGVDESGKGDFFGPLVIASVFAEGEGVEELVRMGVKDSKRLKDPVILKLASAIGKKFPHHIVQIGPEKYNSLYGELQNLNRLLAWGHATAIKALVEKTGCSDVIIDQFASESVVERALGSSRSAISLTQRVRGEEDPVVAAASILARAAFVEGLKKLEERAGMHLPKGASQAVVEAAVAVARERGIDFLKIVAKIHFATYAQVLARVAHA